MKEEDKKVKLKVCDDLNSVRHDKGGELFAFSSMVPSVELFQFRLDNTDHAILNLDKKVDKLEDKVDKLENKMDKRFEQVDKRFEQIDKKFDDKFDKLYGILELRDAEMRRMMSNITTKIDLDIKELRESTERTSLELKKSTERNSRELKESSERNTRELQAFTQENIRELRGVIQDNDKKQHSFTLKMFSLTIPLFALGLGILGLLFKFEVFK